MSRTEHPERLPLFGLAFVVLLFAMIVLAVLSYAGVFVNSRDVTLYLERSGNQLGVGAQVKLNGVVVGTVKELSVSGTDAKVTLALDPGYTHLIPKNVKARVLPKTLIGQDYVDLVPPAVPSTATIAAGDVIARDRSRTAVELETALNSLLTTLDKVPPQKLAVTLNALSSALGGRGDQLGRTLETFDRYLGDLNPSIPLALEDLRALARTAQTYDQAAPDLLAALNSFTTTARTLATQRAALNTLYQGVVDAADRTSSFLEANGDNLIDLVGTSRGTLEILARYAPEYPCLLEQLAGIVPRVDAAFGAGQPRPGLRVDVQVGVSRGKYIPKRDEPRYLDDRGPRCYPIMRLAPQYPDGVPLADGSAAPPSSARGTGRISAGSAAPSLDATPNSTTESNLISGMYARNGQPAPPFASLLLGPILRGSEVSVR